MNVSYEGIGRLAITMPNSSAQVGKLCSLDSMGKATLSGPGEPFLGLVEAVDKDMAAVQIQGIVTVSVTGSCPPRGYIKLISDGNGGVKTDASGKEYWVIAANNTASTITMKL